MNFPPYATGAFLRWTRRGISRVLGHGWRMESKSWPTFFILNYFRRNALREYCNVFRHYQRHPVALRRLLGLQISRGTPLPIPIKNQAGEDQCKANG